MSQESENKNGENYKKLQEISFYRDLVWSVLSVSL